MTRVTKTSVRFVFLLVVIFVMKISPASATCASPVGAAGDLLYNSSIHVIQGCNGTVWKGWPKGIAGTWKTIKVSAGHTCGLKTDNTLYCWGRNGDGQVGNGASGPNVLYPTAVSGGGTWTDVDAGTNNSSGMGFTCGIKMGGTLYCWGADSNGQGGDSSNSATSTPRAVAFGGTWKKIELGADWACAIKSDNSAWCWGQNAHNNWGDGVNFGSWFYDARQVASAGSTWKQISANSYDAAGSFTCGLKANSTAWCWGSNSNGQLGYSSSGTGDSQGPVAVVTTGVQTWNSVSAGNTNACGVKTDGTGWCWGNNTSGEVGNGVTGGTYTSPQAVTVSGVTTWANIEAGSDQACGIKTDGTGWCWGYGQEGNNGDGAVVDYNFPHEILPGAKWKSLSAGWPVCGIMTDSTLWCWGENEWGGQGIGHANQTNTPQYVAGSAATTCSSPTGAGGDILFNSDYRVLQWCDGIQWNPAGPISPTGPLAGCASPSGVRGDLLFNSASAIFQYCDGDTWRGLGQ